MHERMLRVLGGILAVTVLTLGSTALYAEEGTTPVNTNTDAKILDTGDATAVERAVRTAAPLIPPGMSNLRELPAGTKLSRVLVGKGDVDGSIASGPPAESLIYSNTLGRVIIPLEPGFLVADDIATIAPDGCQLTRFSFQVFGNANLSVSEDRPYTVTYALYDTCPEAFPSNPNPSRLISGTFGTQPVDGAASTNVVEVEVPLSSVSGKTSMWLAITFNRDNCAVIGGAPAIEGFSGDLFSFPALGCSPNFGTFPSAPHGSFNAEIYGEPTTCPCRHLKYRNTREDGFPLNVGSNKVLVDDIRLLADGGSCLLTGYEVALRGAAVYDLELRNGCEGDPPGEEWFPNGTSAAIAGTYKKQIISSSSNGTRIIRVPVDPPVLLSSTVFLAVKVNNPNGGPILTAIQGKIGNTEQLLQQMTDDGGCTPAILPTANAQGALQATLICDSCARPGACCDMFTKQCDDGANEFEPCRNDTDCEAPGLCNAPCREVPLVNCAFPIRGTLQLPAWVGEAICDPENDPFSDQINGAVCGTSACCFEDTDGVERCRNRFERDCDVIGNTKKPRQWQLGRFCGQQNQSCPLIACLGREGDCKEPHLTAGCSDSECCSAVCRADFDDFCCQFEWDLACVEVATGLVACDSPPRNDRCTGANVVEGYANATVKVIADTAPATVGDEDPLVCCHNGSPNECISGPDLGELCETDADCSPGACGPGAPVGRHTVWYKFIAEDTSVSIDTCLSVPPALDSMLALFKAGDPDSDALACGTLGLIGCNDDGCAGDPGAFSDANSRLCVRDLVVGDLYYVMVSTKRNVPFVDDPADRYEVRFQSPCPDERPLANDFCDFAEPVTDTDCKGCDPVPTDLTDATLQCPAPFDAPGMASDQWFEYTATCTGDASVSTCGSGFDTSVFVYEGCGICPDFETIPLAFNDNSDACGLGSQESAVTFPTVAGDCFRIRVGDQSGAGTTGELNISCSSACPTGDVVWVDPPINTVDPGRPWLSGDPTHARLGIEKITVRIVPDGPQGGATATNVACWEICENSPLDGIPVEIQGIVPGAVDEYEITLSRPLTDHAATTIEYLGNQLTKDFTRITTHPGNVDGDFSAASAGDIFQSGDPDNLVTRLRLVFDPDFNPPFPPLQGEPYSLDINRSGAFNPLDLIDLVDLMNGADQYPVENQTEIPGSPICPND